MHCFFETVRLKIYLIVFIIVDRAFTCQWQVKKFISSKRDRHKDKHKDKGRDRDKHKDRGRDISIRFGISIRIRLGLGISINKVDLIARGYQDNAEDFLPSIFAEKHS